MYPISSKHDGLLKQRITHTQTVISVGAWILEIRNSLFQRVLYLALIRHRQSYIHIMQSGSSYQAKKPREPGGYLLPSYLYISMIQRIQPLPFIPNLNHNLRTAQFIQIVKSMVVFRTLTLLHVYHFLLKCGIEILLPLIRLKTDLC